MIKRIFILIVIGIFLSSGALAQASRKNLTTLLRELSEERKIVISFSPTFADRIYPRDNSLEGELSQVLTRLLKGNALSFKQLKDGNYLIIKHKETAVPRKKTEKPVEKKESASPIVIPMTDFAIPVSLDSMKTEFPLPILPPQSSLYASKMVLPDMAIKSNLLYAATTTLNLGIEIGLAEKWTLDISANFNPWKFSDNVRLRHWMVQPEVRYWSCERFNRHFFGFHAHYAQYNVGALPDWSFVSDNMKLSRYQGYLYGAGVSYGYHWVLNNKWSLESVIGIGYARLHHDKFPCADCGDKIKSENRNYFGPTKVAVNLIYIIK